MEIKSQYKEGDQGPNKVKFWKSGLKKCPKCGKTDIQRKQDVCGCRMNGDGYGVELFTCLSCKWKTSFLYDDVDDFYFYEARNW